MNQLRILRTLLLSGSLFLISLNVNAQSTQFKVYTLELTNEGYDHIDIKEQSGAYYSLIEASNLNIPKMRNKVLKHQPFDLELIWTGQFKDLPGSLSDVLYYPPLDLLALSDNKLVYVSSSRDAVSEERGTLLNWFDNSTGEVKRVEKYSHPDDDLWTCFGSILRPDSATLLLPGLLGSENTFLLYCVDTSGQVLWTKQHELDVFGFLQITLDIKVMPDSSIIVLITSGTTFDKKTYLLRLDSMGNFISFNETPFKGSGQALALHPSGNLVFLCMPDLNSTGPTCTRVVMVDPVSLDSIWSREFWHWEPPYICKGLSTASLQSLSVQENGNILVGVESGRKYFLVEYTAEGIELWRRVIDVKHYIDSLNYSSPIFGHSIRTSDGGILLGGVFQVKAENPVDYAYRVFLLKLDSVGCLVPGCDKTIITSTEAEEVRLENGCWKLTPNPAGAWVQVMIDQTCPRAHLVDRVVIYDHLGKIIRIASGQPGQDQYMLDTSLLPSGNYVVQLLAGPVILGAKTLIIAN